MAKDSWGRTLASHGILSANPQVFEVTMSALRADVLDEEVRADSEILTERNCFDGPMNYLTMPCWASFLLV